MPSTYREIYSNIHTHTLKKLGNAPRRSLTVHPNCLQEWLNNAPFALLQRSSVFFLRGHGSFCGDQHRGENRRQGSFNRLAAHGHLGDDRRRLGDGRVECAGSAPEGVGGYKG